MILDRGLPKAKYSACSRAYTGSSSQLPLEDEGPGESPRENTRVRLCDQPALRRERGKSWRRPCLSHLEETIQPHARKAIGRC